jgi:N-acetylglucosamine kinase-like BadF-type ATPase
LKYFILYGYFRMVRYFLGVDVGNTKSHSLICDENGNAKGFGVGGPGNHESIGEDAFMELINDIVIQAITSSCISKNDLSAAGFGIAGYNWSEDLPMLHRVIDSLGLDVPYGVMNDAGPGLFAGSSDGCGVSVVAGTGANARGRNRHGKLARLTGHGTLFGEVGGGGTLARHIIGEISKVWSHRGKPTVLSDMFVEKMGAIDVEDLLAGITRDRYTIKADLALTVFQAARDGDVVAKESIRWLGEGLGDMACGVIRQLGIEDEEFTVVLSGSLFKGSHVIQEALSELVLELAPRASFLHITAPPVTFSVMFAMDQVGADYVGVRQDIIMTGEQMLADSLNAQVDSEDR